MRDLRIVFLGTPDFAVETLRAVLAANYKVVGVITAPDRPAGRGRKLKQSAVKEFALSKNLPVFQPVNLKSEVFLDELKNLEPNVQIVVAFRMLPKVVWDLPEFGTFNLHASMLPQYRGAAPINWAIINGEESTGVSTFFIDENIDTGEMILQNKNKITEHMTAGELHDKLMHTGAKLVVETLNKLKENRITTKKQKENTDLKEAPKLDKENTRINWDKPALHIYNLIRGLNPYPGAWSLLENKGEESKVKIYESEIEFAYHKLDSGKISLDNKQLKIAVTDGFIVVKEIQLPGKRKMKTSELLNGFELDSEAKMG